MEEFSPLIYIRSGGTLVVIIRSEQCNFIRRIVARGYELVEDSLLPFIIPALGQFIDDEHSGFKVRFN